MRSVIFAACVLLAIAGCAPVRAAGAGAGRPPSGSAAPVYGPVPEPRPQLTPNLSNSCQQSTGFPCAMWNRILQVQHYIAHQPGQIGVVFHDRLSGATWSNKDAGDDFPAASTIKLAIIADVLRRAKTGSLALTPADWDLINNILYDSDDAAGDQLWFAYENPGFVPRIHRFGMHSASFSSAKPYWGFTYCSAQDLDNLMDYILDKLPAHDRDYIVYRMRRVGPIERWGVWGAGRANHPGNKDGWENEGSVWITNTVGFAGPHEQYTLAIMDNLDGAGNFHQGSTTLNEIASILFRGHLSPAPLAEATPEVGQPTPY